MDPSSGEAASVCELNCTDPTSYEVYYSFVHVLDDVTNGAEDYILPLKGDNNPLSAFYQTGWTGATGVSRDSISAADILLTLHQLTHMRLEQFV